MENLRSIYDGQNPNEINDCDKTIKVDTEQSVIIANQKKSQRLIFKISSTRLRNCKWNLNISIPEARKNGEVRFLYRN